jgi:PIN domain nuclease of toxin-antitoxin system
MNLLIDTHIILWYLEDNPSLSVAMGDVLESSDHNIYLSITSLWEIAIKVGVGRLDLGYSFDELQIALTQFKIIILPIEVDDLRQYLALPLHHRDPFDRIIIAQAITQNLQLVSRDGEFPAYPVQLFWR